MKRVPNLLLELNSQLIWRWDEFIECITQAEKLGYTGIIIHQQELLSILVSPSKNAIHAHNENLIHQQNYSLQYLKRISEYLSNKNLTFWLQGEAAPQDDIISKKFPEFNYEGSNAPNFWAMFYDSFLESIFNHIPKFDGIILSLTMPEFQPDYWQDALHHIWRRLRQQGKKLVLRDFIDTGWPRRQLPLVLSKLPDDVRASFKPTELDFHPGFTHHPHIEMVPNNKKWLEYDLWGTGYGWSYLPCFLADEIQQRIQWAMNLAGEGIEAITTRICWQWIPGRTTFDSVNIINVLGLKLFNSGVDDLTTQLEEEWLKMSHVKFSSSIDQQLFFNAIRSSYSWFISTPNILGRRLHYQSQIPQTLAHARQLMHMDTRSARWQLSYEPFLPTDDKLTGQKQRELVALEKEKAEFIANAEYQCLSAMAYSVSDPEGHFKQALSSWKIAQLYGRMFNAVSLATTEAIWFEQYSDHSRSRLLKQQNELLVLADNLDQFCQTRTAPDETALPLLLNSERLTHFANSLISDS